MLIYSGNKHDTKAVLTLASAGPLIEVQPKDISVNKLFDIDSDEMDMVNNNKDLILYQYDGKYYVVAGVNKMDHTKPQTGRLLTSFALKKARVIENVPQENKQDFKIPSGTGVRVLKSKFHKNEGVKKWQQQFAK